MIYVQCLNWASFSEHLSVSNRVHSYILCPTVKLVLLSTMYVCVLSAIFGVDFPIELNSKFSLYYYSVFSSFVYSSDLSLNTTTNTNLLWKLSKKKQFFNLHVLFLLLVFTYVWGKTFNWFLIKVCLVVEKNCMKRTILGKRYCRPQRPQPPCMLPFEANNLKAAEAVSRWVCNEACNQRFNRVDRSRQIDLIRYPQTY